MRTSREMMHREQIDRSRQNLRSHESGVRKRWGRNVKTRKRKRKDKKKKYPPSSPAILPLSTVMFSQTIDRLAQAKVRSCLQVKTTHLRKGERSSAPIETALRQSCSPGPKYRFRQYGDIGNDEKKVQFGRAPQRYSPAEHIRSTPYVFPFTSWSSHVFSFVVYTFRASGDMLKHV